MANSLFIPEVLLSCLNDVAEITCLREQMSGLSSKVNRGSPFSAVS